MLIISRRPGEKIMVGEDVVIEILEVSASTVRIGVDAPRSVRIYREEVFLAVREENVASAASDPADLPQHDPTNPSPPKKRNE